MRVGSVSLFFGLVFLAPANASGCDLTEFDSKAPEHISDTTPATDKSSFEWGADVDPFKSQWRSWHYIKNNHKLALSVEWEKGKITIPFNRPLPENEVVCIKSYGAQNGFVADSAAPIHVSNDGDKDAVAFVPINEESSVRGVDIQTTYLDDNKVFGSASASLIVQYSEKNVQIGITTGEGTSVAFNPAALGVDGKFFVLTAAQMGAKVEDYEEFGTLFHSSKWLASFVPDTSDLYAVVSSANTVEITLERTGTPAVSTPLLILGKDASVVAATDIQLREAAKQ